MKNIIILFIALMSCLCINAEVRIQMEKDGGVYKIPCQVNGLKLKFIFDTGASAVSISLSCAEMMLENDYLKETDIKGTSKSSLADGSIVDNVVVNLRSVVIGGQTIENVSAIVVPTQNAPLLLGQSVIQRLGKVSIDGDYLVIHNANIYSESEIEAIYKKANELCDNQIYSEALKYYKIVNDFWGDNSSPWLLFFMGICYSNLKDYDSAIKCHLKAVELDDGDNENDILYEIYSRLTSINGLKGDYSKALEYSLLGLKYATDDEEKAKSYQQIAMNYKELKKYSEAVSYADKSINTYKLLAKKKRLYSYHMDDYIWSYFVKATSLNESRKYNEAIESYMAGKTILENNKEESFYQEYIDLFNMGLSQCYSKLVNY